MMCRARCACPSLRGAQAEHALCWLACPMLSREVDKMEERGGISAMASVVNAFPGLSTALEAVHGAAPALRRWMLPPAWVKRVETEEAFEAANFILFRTG